MLSPKTMFSLKLYVIFTKKMFSPKNTCLHQKMCLNKIKQVFTTKHVFIKNRFSPKDMFFATKKKCCQQKHVYTKKTC